MAPSQLAGPHPLAGGGKMPIPSNSQQQNIKKLFMARKKQDIILENVVNEAVAA